MPERRDVLARSIAQIRQLRDKLAQATAPIAIVGMGCRMPGADDPDALWTMTREGRDATSEPPDGRWASDEPPGIYTRHGGWLPQVDRFDAAFFGISAREARTLDPQQRLFLEVAWEALEHAAIPPAALRQRRVGVYCGITNTDFQHVLASSDQAEALDFYSGSGTALSFAAGRLAHTLGLRGPALAIDTACSSSLVAVHLAVTALRRGEIDAALVGGVNLILTPAVHAILCRGRALSRSGRCQTFDDAADGYARGEGCGVVLLERLSDAQRDGDPVLAVIRGTAINHDGPSSGLTVPSGSAQEAVIAAACADAGVQPADIAYVEAHGTGTSLGDPIEVRALAAAMGPERTEPLRVGSIKSNIGHLEAAAGIAGLIKATLALQHGVVPPHIGAPNPSTAIRWDRLPVAIAQDAWSLPEQAVVGVSAFGASGTNAHVLLSAAPERAQPSPSPQAQLLVLSAASPEALTELAGRYAHHLRTRGQLAELCHTAAVGRAALPHVATAVAESTDEMAERLDAIARRSPPAHTRPDAPPAIAFVFAGQGGQRADMGRALFEHPGPFRDAIEACDAILRDHRDVPLVDVLYGSAGADLLHRTEWTQPALFAVEWALFQQWQAWGVEASWVLGHSLGAFTAACAAGVAPLADMLPLVARRAALMQSTAPGSMARVQASPARVQEVLSGSGVSIAAHNGVQDVVISGDPAAVQESLAALEAAGVTTAPLKVHRAFHSGLMDPITAAFQTEVAALALSRPAIAFISDRTGSREGDAVQTPGYWARHLREPVRFLDALQTLSDEGCRLCVELGPGRGLSALGRTFSPATRWVTSLHPRLSARVQMLRSLGELVEQGAQVDLTSVSGTDRRIAAPTTPFQRKRHWIGAARGHSLLGQRTTGPDGQIRFSSVWRPSQHPVLRDHTVFGQVLVSGAVTSAAALQAARETSDLDRVEFDDVAFPSPLVLSERGRPIEVTLRSGPDQVEFQVSSSGECHARGRFRALDEDPPAPVDLDEVKARCTGSLSGEAFYDSLWDPEVHGLGPSFRAVEQIWYREGEALGRLRTPVASGLEPAHLAAAICQAEAAGQLLMPAIAGFRELFTDPRTTFLGSGMTRSVEHVRAPGQAAWVHATLTEHRDNAFAGDISLLDEDGRVLVVMEGLGIQRVSRALLQGRFAPAVAPTRSTEDLDTRVRELVVEILGDTLPSDEVSLASLGFDSLMAVELVERVHRESGVRLDQAGRLREVTLSVLLERVRGIGRESSSTRGCWRRLGPAVEGGRRWLCLAHAGGNALSFSPWLPHVPDGVELWAAQLPGRWDDPGTQPVSDLDVLIERLAEDLPLDRPFAFFGASLGGLLAYHLCRALRRRGLLLPEHLVVAAAAAPDRAHPLVAHADDLRAALSGTGDDSVLDALGLLPASLRDPDVRSRFLPSLRADLELVLTYEHRPEPPLPIPLTALAGRQDPGMPRSQVAAWLDHTSEDFALGLVDGGHLFYRERPVETLAACRGLVQAGR